MAEFYTILTSIGQAKIANSQVTGQKINLVEIAAGDGNGSYYNPDQSQTALRKEVWRGNISAVQIDEENPNWIVIEGVIPSSAGGFFVREVGVFDEEGDLIAIGKYPETYKPVATEGSAKDLYIRMIIEVTNASAVQLKIDPSVIIASREYVDKNLEQKANQVKQEAKNYTDQQMAVTEANAKNYTDQKIAQLPDLTWDNLQDKPSAFPPSSHTHNISEVTGLQAALQDIENKIGDLSNLSTDQKANLVAAVNELKTRLDNMGDTTGQSLTQLMNALNELIDEVAAHEADDVSQGEVHGLRVTDGKLEYFDGQQWQRVKGDGYPVGNVSNFRAKAGNGEVILTWEDPTDVTITDSNNNVITIARWKGTKILRKTGSYPQTENDGVLVVDNGIRNQYAENGFKVTGLTNGQTYYFMAFPYTDEGVYTVDEANRVEATPTEQHIYGVRIDKNNSNPETRVTYIGDAVGFTPMRGNNGNFQWGSWQGVFESFEIRPCVLKNKQVQYYLDPNDFTKKVDGSSANLTGDDGDVMIEFGKTLWWKWTDEGDTYTIEISDKEFDGAVKHAFEIEEGYNLVPYYPLLLTQILFVIFFKSTDSQTALGRGRVDGATGYASTGGTDKKGMFYGSTIDEQMKFLGIEDYWGNKFWWIDGLVADSNYNLLIGKGNFNGNGSGYQSFTSGVSSNTYGYIDSVQGGNDKGFIIRSNGGSATTYYADYGFLHSARVARFGGDRSARSDAGFAYLLLDGSESGSRGEIGARLFCASNGKIYIGAYLGTSQNGKLRSISGTSEPTGGKTIKTFRTEARANN